MRLRHTGRCRGSWRRWALSISRAALNESTIRATGSEEVVEIAFNLVCKLLVLLRAWERMRGR